MKTTFIFEFDLETRDDGEEYMKVTKSYLDTQVGRAKFLFQNLFGGDRLLGKFFSMFRNYRNYKMDQIKKINQNIFKLLHNTVVIRST